MTPDVRRRDGGFTLPELIIVLVLVMLAALIGFPLLQKTIVRSNLEGAAQELASALRLARLEAIRRSAPAVVVLDTATNQVATFVDFNDDDPDADNNYRGSDLIYNPDDAPLCPPSAVPEGCLRANERDRYVNEALQLTRQAKLGGPAGDPAIVDGFTDRGDGPRVVFSADGSVVDVGGFRLNDGVKDDAGVVLNFLEVRVSPASAARVQLLKWNKDDGKWYTRDMKDGKSTWKWY